MTNNNLCIYIYIYLIHYKLFQIRSIKYRTLNGKNRFYNNSNYLNKNCLHTFG